MASRFDLPAPWTKDARKVTPIVLEINGSGAAAVLQPVDKYRVKNTKPLRWVLLLNTRRAVGCIAWLGAALWSRLRAVKKRLVLRQVESAERGKAAKAQPLLKFIGSLLVLAVATLALELVACWNGWHLEKRSNLPVPETDGILRWMRLAYVSWRSFRANHVAYPVQTMANFCVVLFVLMLLDRFVLFLGWMWIKLKKIKPRIEGKRFKSSDEIPMVLVQIPMCNEREVYRQSIFCSCRLDWPKDRLLIQVLDDSDDNAIQALIRSEVSMWSELGMNIIYQHRSTRTGYKAGNLKSGMSCDYVKNYEFVAIFDADFQPRPDFLKKTIPHFKDNPELGLVQARWSFVNKDENLLTRLQNVNLSFHFEVEQQVGGAFFNFFGFNGTAGVWRIKALEGSGGWLDRTTVEDMDIAVRAHLNGWKFIFLDDVKVLCEAPESYEAYTKQQYRWHSGPMLLFQLCLPAIITSKIPLWKKGNLILLFFLLRKLLLPFYCFTLFCIVLPSTMFVPEVKVQLWVICYAPIFMSLFNNLPHRRSLPLVMPYLLFENTMSVTKFDAMISGLFQMGNSHEWIVTKKAGRLFESAEKDSKTLNQRNKLKGTKSTTNKSNKIYKKELALALLLLTAAVRNLLSFEGIYFCLLLFQGVAFLIVGLDLIGEQIM